MDASVTPGVQKLKLSSRVPFLHWRHGGYPVLHSKDRQVMNVGAIIAPLRGCRPSYRRSSETRARIVVGLDACGHRTRHGGCKTAPDLVNSLREAPIRAEGEVHKKS